jgi:hypothetical protein
LSTSVLDDPDVRQVAVLNAYAKYFGPKALDAIDYLEKIGCSNHSPPAVSQLRRPG